METKSESFRTKTLFTAPI